MKDKNFCCDCWESATSGITVTPKNTSDEMDKHVAKTMEQLLKYVLGNYCPTCGRKIKK